MAFLSPLGHSSARSPQPPALCSWCRRAFTSTSILHSGHNRWSKIRHEKGAADKKKVQASARQSLVLRTDAAVERLVLRSRDGGGAGEKNEGANQHAFVRQTAERLFFARNLTLCSKLYGANPDLNAQLAKTIAEAKKSGMPKANIELAIARGQGRSSTGEKLETAMLELLGPGSVAVIIETECNNKQRAIRDLKHVAKKHAATVTPTTFLFTRLGRIILALPGGHNFDSVFMQAVEAGAEDVEQDDDGNVVIWTQPNVTHQAAQNLSAALREAEIVTSDIIWKPSEDTVKLQNERVATQLAEFLAAVRDNDDVQAVYANVEQGEISNEMWSSIEDSLD